MSSRSPRVLAALGGAVLAHIALIASSIACVAAYSHLVAPGLSMDRYRAFAEASGPWVSTLIGIPVFYLLCRWQGRVSPEKSQATAVLLLASYIGSDLAILVAYAPVSEVPWHLVALSYLSKVAAGWWGAQAAIPGVAKMSA